MDTSTLLLSHLTVLTLGASSGWVVARWQGRKIIRRIEENAMADTTPDREHPLPDRRRKQRGPTPGALALIILLACMMLIGFGIQQSLYQERGRETDRRLDARDTCIQEWGEDMVDVLRGRVSANDYLAAAQKELDRVQSVTDDRLYAIVGFIIAERHNPSPTVEEQDARFAAVLDRFAAAKARLDRLKAEFPAIEKAVRKAKKANPYPTLVLDCPDEDE